MKKVCQLIFVSVLIILAGCGKVAQETQDISNPEDTIVEQKAPQASETEFVNSVKNLLANLNVGNVEMQKTETPTNVLSGFSLAGVDTYAYWNYESITVNNGNIIEVYKGQYRFYDKRTGLPFEKPVVLFSVDDQNNIDYIERFLQVRGFYQNSPYDPNKTIYKMNYHEKIVPQGNNYSFTLYADNLSTMEYIGWPWSALTITQRDIEYNKNGKSGSGMMRVVAAAPYQSLHFEFACSVIDDKKRGDSQIYYGDKLLANLKIVGTSNDVETQYYVGKSYYYTNLSSLVSGLEDNIVIEFQDDQQYTETTTFDGSANLSATTPKRNQDMRITSKTGLGKTPELLNLLTIKKFDGVIVEKLKYSQSGIRFIDCSKVTINGVYYAYITDQVFKN